ncbi:GmrSD restriction endonuclease domain-containing protein [Streptomyces althioticus]|uniref:GmrSD restriction endonuclease domain-containing protein n=1 Tax=Streptomyces althioticus TaxID=83380 RepID=UPI003EB7D3F5
MSTPTSTELSVEGESIQQLYNDYTSEKFLVNRRYQRKLVWGVEEKERLIDSVVQKLPIPLILLAESSGEHSGRLEVIDGLQRLNSVFSFIENEFSLNGEYFDLATLADTKIRLDGGSLKQKTPVLDREICRRIANYRLPVSIYRSASDESVDEVFRRINSSGRHLSPHEIRQAGATQTIATMVRRLAATVRGDASFTDFVPLSGMAKISITNHDLPYGIYVENIFWVKQGILTRESVRESRDEELVLDILLDLMLERPAATGLRYRDSAYGIENDRAVTSSDVVHRRIVSLGEAELEDRFVNTLELIQNALNESSKPFAALTVTQQNYRGVPRHFQAVFVAINQLLHDESLELKSNKDLLGILSGFWDGDLRIPSGGGDWGSDRKNQLLEMAKAALRPAFQPKTDAKSAHLRDHSVRFEAALSMALTEDSLFELKQGFCRINDSATFDDASFAKILRTASAMANHGRDSKGVIFIGVADDAADAAAVERFAQIKPLKYEEFFVTGTQHELSALKKSMDELWRELTQRIKTSKLDLDFAESLARTLAPFRYKGYLLWRLEPASIGRPVTYDNRFYQRVGPQTAEVVGQSIIALANRFQ